MRSLGNGVDPADDPQVVDHDVGHQIAETYVGHAIEGLEVVPVQGSGHCPTLN